MATKLGNQSIYLLVAQLKNPNKTHQEANRHVNQFTIITILSG